MPVLWQMTRFTYLLSNDKCFYFLLKFHRGLFWRSSCWKVAMGSGNGWASSIRQPLPGLMKTKKFIDSQNGRHFPDDIFKCVFLNEKIWILIKISLKFIPKGSIDNILALVQIMAWRRPGDKPLSDQWWLVHPRIHASLGLNELYTSPDLISLTRM